MKNFLYTNRRIVAALIGVILIVIGGTYYLKYLESERMVEAERNMHIEYPQWHLPENAKARIGMGAVTAMHYSPDGNQLAVVSDIGVWLLNPNTFEPLHLLAAHTGVVNSISFSRDGRTLAVGTKNGTAQLWDASTGEHQETFTRREYSFGVDKVFLMPDGQTLAVIHSNSALDLYDISTGELKNAPTTTAENNSDTKVRNSPYCYMNMKGYRCTFSADGKTVASESEDDTFRFWDITTRKEIRTLKAERSSRYEELVSFSSDLQKVAVASQSQKYHWRKRINEHVLHINLWDVNSQTQQKIAESYNIVNIPFLVFSPDSNLFASYIKDAIRIWDVNTGKEMKRLRGHSRGVNVVAFSPDNRTLVSNGWDDSLRVWDIKTGKVKKIIGGYGSFFYRNVYISDDSQTLMTLKVGSRSIRIWDPNTGKHDKTFIGAKKYLWGVDFSHDGGKLASRSAFNKTIHLWDVNTGTHSKLKGASRSVSGIAFSQDGEMLSSWGYAGGRKDVVQLWDSDTGQKKRTLYLSEPDDLGWSADAYFDKEMFATIGSYYPDLFVWNLVTGEYEVTECADKEIRLARFSPDGKLLAIVMDNEIVLRDVKTGNQIGTLTGHEYRVRSIAFSPDSKTLASGGEFRDKTMRLWDIETGSSRIVMDPDWEVRYYNFDATVASTLAFSSDGQTLVSGMKSGIIYLWETATGDIKQILRGHTDRVSHLFFSSGAKTLISASDDGSILIWDLTGNSN